VNDTSPKIAVIATRMPFIDRRSLSEAWFSALHLASDGKPPAASRERRNLVVTAGTMRATISTRNASPARQLPRAAGAQPRTLDAPRGNPEITTRRAFDARVAATARAAYERARSYPPFQSTLTLETRGERVQLVLRREGATLHVVALCRPELAETVRRALACADTHVRSRGEAIRSSVRVIAPGEVTA